MFSATEHFGVLMLLAVLGTDSLSAYKGRLEESCFTKVGILQHKTIIDDAIGSDLLQMQQNMC